MKKIVLLTSALFFAFLLQAQTKNSEVVFSTEPEIECQNCVKRIKDNLRFEKGVKAINPDMNANLVTIQYDGGKTNPEKLQKALAKIGYKATVVVPEEKKETEEKKENNN